jgi:hypothetical protein
VLERPAGRTQIFAPLGRPYKLAFVSAAQLQSFQGFTFNLVFRNPRELRIRYKVRTIVGFPVV